MFTMAVGDKQASGRNQGPEAETETALLAPRDDDRHSAKHGSLATYSVTLLDGTAIELEVSAKLTGHELFDIVCERLRLEERDYFCLSYLDNNNTRFWLHPDKSVSSQINKQRRMLYFEVKFYPKEPTTDLHYEQTRYLLFLQVRLDILVGKVPASFVSHQLLGSYAVQSDIGDYDVDEHGSGIAYIKEMQFSPNQSDELLEKIAKLHVMHRGMSAPDAEKNYLDNAKLLAFYGVDFHFAVVRNHQDVTGDVVIGVSAHGLTVYQQSLNIYRWPWQAIIDFSYNRGGFSVKVRPKADEKAAKYKYKMRYNMAKRLWQSAVEHHAFFRLNKPLDSERAAFPKVGSKFRYMGRTQHQVGGAPESNRPALTIQRGAGTRFMSRGPTDTVDTSTPGYSTDRAENYYVDPQHSASNTLSLPDRKKQPVYTAQDSDADGTRTSVVPIAGFEDDDTRVALLSESTVSYSKEPPDQHNTSSFTAAPVDTTTTESVTTTTTTSTKHTTVNIVMTTGNRDGDEVEEMLPPYQDDHEALLRPSRQRSVEKSPEESSSATRESKTTSRTYTDSEGNVITEHTLERDGVVEKRVEKRTVIEEGDETDYDKALMEAIKAVTDMNQDLSVEKIEIQTNADRV